MAMKPVFKFLVATGICVATNAVFANKAMVSPYLGLEYKLSYTRGKNVSWRQLLPTNNVNNNGTVFLGINFHKCISGEFGFTKSNSHTKYSDTSGLVMFGNNGNAGSKQAVKLSYKGTSFDLNGQYPAGDAFSFLGTIGVVSVKPKIQAANLGTAGGAPNGNDPIATIKGKSRMAARLGIGAQYVQGMFGIRTRILWEGTSRVKADLGTFPTILPAQDKLFKDTLAWTLGVFVRW